MWKLTNTRTGDFYSADTFDDLANLIQELGFENTVQKYGDKALDAIYEALSGVPDECRADIWARLGEICATEQGKNIY